MNELVKKIQTYANQLVLDKKRRKDSLFTISCAIFGIVATFMTIVNVVTAEHTLMYITLVFAILCLFSFALNMTRKSVLQEIARVLFVSGVMLMFGTFIVTGHPDGFSVIWTTLLPVCGLLVFEMAWGVLFSLIQWAVLIFFFWTPIGRSLLQFQYGETFMTRFPMLYFAAFAIGFALAGMFFMTQNESRIVAMSFCEPRSCYQQLSS